MQTWVQSYFASQSANSRNPFENEEKRACLYSVLPFASVMPIQAYIHVLCTSNPQQFLRKILNIARPPIILFGESAGTGCPAKSSRFVRDKFTGYAFAPFVDAFTDSRHHIIMRGSRYTAPPLTSSGSVVCRHSKHDYTTNLLLMS